MVEELKPIEGWENLYKISSFGRIFSVRKNRFLSLSKPGKKGYLIYILCNAKEKIKKSFKPHRLVALYFVDNPQNKDQVNHIDGDKTNNHYSNLEWVNNSENQKHAYRLGLHTQAGESNNFSKLTESDVLEMRRLYSIGVDYHSIAELFSVTYPHVWSIINKKAWKHI